MNRLSCAFLSLALPAGALFGAEPGAPPVSKIFDQQLTMVEREIVPLAEAMPADKYGFAPTNGEFKDVRTFGQQVSHVAAVIYAASASVLVEKNPSETGKDENGPASLKTKDDIVKYLKDALAYGHRAMAALTDQNLTAMVPSAPPLRAIMRATCFF
ncbi:MAG: DinB family protein [Acidobacteria bacterium]|nr:DinB family protein [Acidobacteriota bacterium]